MKDRKPTLGLLLRLIFRGTLLFLGLSWFVHYKLTTLPKNEILQKEETFLETLSRKTRMRERRLRRVLTHLGPAIARELEKGNQVKLPGLGSFKVQGTPPLATPGNGDRQTAFRFIDYQPSPELVSQMNKVAAGTKQKSKANSNLKTQTTSSYRYSAQPSANPSTPPKRANHPPQNHNLNPSTTLPLPPNNNPQTLTFSTLQPAGPNPNDFPTIVPTVPPKGPSR